MRDHTLSKAGVTVTTEAEITDYWSLGKHLAEFADNEEQVQFLHGLMTGFQLLGRSPLGFQLDAIRDDAKKKNIDLRELLGMVKEIVGDYS